MALRIEWLGLAEGAAQDSRGAFALIGINQNVVVAPSLPQTSKQAFVLILIDDNDGPVLVDGAELTLDFKVESPKGVVIAAARSGAKFGDKQFPELPVSFQFVAESLLRFDEYGAHIVRCVVSTSGKELGSAEKHIYVVEPQPEAGTPKDSPTGVQSGVSN